MKRPLIVSLFMLLILELTPLLGQEAIPRDGLVLWLEADMLSATHQNGNPVTDWKAFAGPSAVLTQDPLVNGQKATPPTFIAEGINGRPVVRFDGVNNELSVLSQPVANQLAGRPFTIFMVSRSGSGAFGFNGNKANGSGDTPRFYVQRLGMVYSEIEHLAPVETHNGASEVLTLQYDGQGHLSSFLNGAASKTINVEPVQKFGGEGNISIPHWAGNTPHAGDLALLLIYQRALSEGERTSVENHALKKYLAKENATPAPAATAESGPDATGNLVYNSGFELGMAGYACTKYLDPKKDPKLEYVAPEIDRSEKMEGEQSLKIPIPFGEGVNLQLKEIRLKPNTKYSISVWAKSLDDDFLMTYRVESRFEPFGSNDESYRLSCQSTKRFRLSREWKRYDFELQTSPDKTLEYYSPRLEFGEFEKPRVTTLWLDNFQITEGALKPYQRGAAIEVSAQADRELYVRGSNRQATVTCEVINNSETEQNTALSVQISNDFDQALVDSKKFDLVLKPKEKKTLTFPTKIRRLGGFNITPQADRNQECRVHPGYFAVIDPYVQKPINLSRDFCVGLNESFGCVPASPGPGFTAPGRSPEAAMALLSQMGCRLIRDWGHSRFMKWSYVEPEEGKMDFSIPDKALELGERYGINMVPVLGGWEFVNKAPDCTSTDPRFMHYYGGTCYPQWLLEKSTFKNKETLPNSFFHTFPGGAGIALPPVDLWEKFVKAVVERYHGRISHYEIFNEPNFGGGNGVITPEEYFPYLKTAHTVIKAADPQAKVIGFCATGDAGGRMTHFLEGCFKLGGLDYADAVSFHPYGAADLASSPLPADQVTQSIISLIHQYHPKNDMPLWNSELFYLHGGHNFRAGQNDPHQVAWRFLTDLGEGVAQSYPLDAGCLYKVLLQPNMHNQLALMEMRPGMNFVVNNALARFFEGAKPVAKIKWGSSAICYVYERKGQYLAAMWNYGPETDLGVNLPFGQDDITAADMFGNALALETMPLPLQAAPTYLFWKGKEMQPFVEGLKKIKLGHSRPVSLVGARPWPGSKGMALAVALRNNQAQPLKIKASVSGKDMTNRAPVEAQLASDIPQTLVLPMDASPSLPTQISVHVKGKNLALDFPNLKLTETKFALAKGEADARENPINLLGRPSKRFEASKAAFRTWHDDAFLHLQVTVKDNTPSDDPGTRSPWEQDCIELFLDANPSQMVNLANPGAYTDNTARLFILPYAGEGKNLVVMAKGLPLSTKEMKLAVQAFKEGYRADLSIPLAALKIKPPLQGTRFGFDIGVDDANGAEGADSQRIWSTGDGQAYANRLGFGIIELE